MQQGGGGGAHLVNDSVRERLRRRHVEVAVRVQRHLGHGLRAEGGQVGVEHVLGVQDQLRGDLEVCRLGRGGEGEGEREGEGEGQMINEGQLYRRRTRRRRKDERRKWGSHLSLRSAQRLVDHDARVWQRAPLALGTCDDARQRGG